MKTKQLLFIIIAILPVFGFSQDGSPDLSFGTNGIVETDLDGREDFVNAVTQSNNGRIVVVGYSFSTDGTDDKNFIVAYLENGEIDDTFGNNGVLLVEYDGLEFKEVKIQSDEKIIIGSGYGSGFSISRFLEDGTPDLTFGEDGYLTPFLSAGTFRDLIILEEDKLLISGTMTIGGVSQSTLKRYLPNGFIDTSFGNNGTINYLIGNESNSVTGKLQIAEDGGIVLSNRITNSSITSYVIMKCLPDGTLDNSFGINGIATIPIGEEFGCGTSLLFPDESILVNCNYFDDEQEIIIRKMLKLTSEEGTIDLSFGSDGYIEGNVAHIIQPNQRILMKNISHWYEDTTLWVRRFYSTGSLDPTFNYSTNYDRLFNYYLNLQNNGNILVVGSSTWETTITADIVLQQYHNDPLGTQDYQLDQFYIYPNPSSGIFKIHHDFISSETPYLITDITGKLIQSGTVTAKQTELNLSAVQSGMYLFTTSGSTFRLIKN